ncbi:MAG TPA: ABC transporter ATP-binding protein, partial [Pseudomonadales bacterium]|nr:ABC transporter ATP-binding protein [Pseudomonadales bacterium]
NQKLKRELLVLPETVEVEEETLAGLHRLMSSDDFYQRPLPEQRDMVGRAEEVQTRINSLMDRWETLEKLLD